MRVFKISLGIVITITDEVVLLRSNNNKWSVYEYDWKNHLGEDPTKTYNQREIDLPDFSRKAQIGCLRTLFGVVK